MIQHNSRPFYQALGIGLLPSAESLVFCLLFGVLIAGLHLVHASLQYGTLAPDAYGGVFGIMYTNGVVGPVLTVINNTIFHSVSAVLLWGLTGLLFFELSNTTVQAVKAWRQADDEVSFSTDTAALHQQLRLELIKRFVWRLAVGGAVLSVLIAMRPLFHYAVDADYHLVTGSLTAMTALQVLLASLVWALALHVLVVLVRFYLLRTRLHSS